MEEGAVQVPDTHDIASEQDFIGKRECGNGADSESENPLRVEDYPNYRAPNPIIERNKSSNIEPFVSPLSRSVEEGAALLSDPCPTASEKDLTRKRVRRDDEEDMEVEDSKRVRIELHASQHTCVQHPQNVVPIPIRVAQSPYSEPIMSKSKRVRGNEEGSKKMEDPTQTNEGDDPLKLVRAELSVSQQRPAHHPRILVSISAEVARSQSFMSKQEVTHRRREGNEEEASKKMEDTTRTNTVEEPMQMKPDLSVSQHCLSQCESSNSTHMRESKEEESQEVPQEVQDPRRNEGEDPKRVDVDISPSKQSRAQHIVRIPAEVSQSPINRKRARGDEAEEFQEDTKRVKADLSKPISGQEVILALVILIF